MPRAIDLAHITLCTRAIAEIINKIVDELLNKQEVLVQNPVFLFGDRHVARDSEASGQHSWKGKPQTVKCGQRGRHSSTFSVEGNFVHFRSNGTFQISPGCCSTKRSSTSYPGPCVKKKREEPRVRIHLPRGLLIVLHSTLNPVEST